jgi:hypothetical protein
MPPWDPEDLKAAIAEHSVVGYQVFVPLLNNGVIDMQIRPEKGGFIFYRVVADTPVPFKTFADRMNVSATPMTLKQWTEKYQYGSHTLPVMAVDLMEQLEAGGKVSPADVTFRALMDRGCIDIDQNVFCYTFPSDDVVIRNPQVGQLVEISESGAPAAWPGRIVGFPKRSVILVEQFAPVPFMRTPEALLPEAVKSGFAVPLSWTFGYGLVHAMEDAGVPVPPGAWSEDKMDYVLDKPVPLERVREFCKKHHPDAGLCVQQALVLHTLPLVAKEVTLRPLPEGTTADEVVVEIAAPDDPEAIDITWPKEEPEEGEEWKG